jgi:signal transduction histidine kinase
MASTVAPLALPPRFAAVAERLADLAVAAIAVLPCLAYAVISGAPGRDRIAVLIAGLIAGGVLLRRRRHPVTALVTLLAVATLAPGPALSAPATLVALATVAAERPWRYGVAAGAATVAAILAHRGVHGATSTLATVISATAVSAAAVTAGLYVATRRAYHRQLSDAAVAAERVRIAHELHDVVAHNVSLMVVQAQALGATAPAEAADTRRATTQIADLGREAMAEMHRTLRLLRDDDGGSAARAPQPGLDRLPDLLERTRAAGVPVALEVQGSPRPLAAGVELSAFRILQEALTNVVKHAHGAAAIVRLRWDADALVLVVHDRGGGGDAVVAPGGHGLVGMQERVALFGGRLRAETVPGGGFRVEATLPYDGRAPA